MAPGVRPQFHPFLHQSAKRPLGVGVTSLAARSGVRPICFALSNASSCVRKAFFMSVACFNEQAADSTGASSAFVCHVEHQTKHICQGPQVTMAVIGFCMVQHCLEIANHSCHVTMNPHSLDGLIVFGFNRFSSSGSATLGRGISSHRCSSFSRK